MEVPDRLRHVPGLCYSTCLTVKTLYLSADARSANFVEPPTFSVTLCTHGRCRYSSQGLYEVRLYGNAIERINAFQMSVLM